MIERGFADKLSQDALGRPTVATLWSREQTRAFRQQGRPEPPYAVPHERRHYRLRLWRLLLDAFYHRVEDLTKMCNKLHVVLCTTGVSAERWSGSPSDAAGFGQDLEARDQHRCPTGRSASCDQPRGDDRRGDRPSSVPPRERRAVWRAERTLPHVHQVPEALTRGEAQGRHEGLEGARLQGTRQERHRRAAGARPRPTAGRFVSVSAAIAGLWLGSSYGSGSVPGVLGGHDHDRERGWHDRHVYELSTLHVECAASSSSSEDDSSSKGDGRCGIRAGRSRAVPPPGGVSSSDESRGSGEAAGVQQEHGPCRPGVAP